MRKTYLLGLIFVFIASMVFAAVELDGDTNGAQDISKGGTNATTAAGARTNLDVDQSGTDNSTDVTLAGSYDYLTLSTQAITLGQVDLSTDVTGVLPELKITGEIQGLVNVLTKGSAYTLGTDEATEVGGSVVIGTAAMVLTLPTASAGYSACFMAGQGVTAIIQLTPASGDYLVIGGIRGTVATAYASDGSAGDKICFVAANSDDWYVTSETGTWSE